MTPPLAVRTSVRIEKKEPGGESPGAPESDGRRWDFSLERDTSGAEDERPVIPEWTRVGYTPMFSGVTEGYAVVRLYAAPYLSPRIRVAGNDTSTQVKHLGERKETITEALNFTGSAEQKLSRGSVATNVSVIDSTSFYDRTGKGSAPPVSVPGEAGVFRAGGEVYGALIVRYTTGYDVYRVPYGLPDDIADALFVQAKPRDEITIPPVHVFAFAVGGYSASLSFERRIGEITVSDGPEWIELERREKTVRVEQTDNPDNYVDVKKTIWLKEQNKTSGRIRETFYKGD